MKKSIFARILSLVLCMAMLCPALALAEEKAEVAVTLPKSLVTIDEEAFRDTAAFGKVIVQNKTKRIESRAFANSAVKEIHLPVSVEYIADDAFEGCENLTLYVPQGSYAHKWAAFSDVKYVAVSDAATAVKYALSGLEFADGVAFVNATADAACVLRVNVLNEADESVLLSYTAEAEAKIQDAQLEVAITGTLPAYFILEAVLEDANGNALCEPVRNISFSQAYANAMASEATDYPAERVIDFGDAGYMVLAEGVTNITENATVSGDTYTIPTSAFGGSLPSVGDVLMLNVNGTPTPVKVGSIAPSKGDSLRIEADSEIYMCDAFDKINVNGYVEAEEGSIGAGVSGKIPLDETYTSKNKMLTVNATGGVGVYVNAQYDKKFLGRDYFEFDTEANVEIHGVVTLHGEYETKQDEIKLTLYDGKIIIPGINLPADLNVFLLLNAGVEGTGTLTIHYEKKVGFTWDTKKGFVEKEYPDGNYADADLEVNFWAETGPKVEIGIGFWEFFNAKVDAQVGVYVDGQLDGNLHAGYEPPVDDEKIHACNLCLAVDVDLFAEANAQVSYKITEKCKGNLLDEQIFRVDGSNADAFNLLDYYCSIVNEEESIFGGKYTEDFGFCPNYKYKVDISTQDMFGKAVKGLNVNVTGSNGSSASITSPDKLHLYDANYTATATFATGEFSEKFSVLGEAKSVVVKEREMVIDILVLDNADDAPLKNVKVVMTKPDGTTKTGYTDAEGVLKFDKLRGGEYSFAFTKDNYESEKLTRTFVSGTSNGITMYMDREKLPVVTAYAEGAGTVTALTEDGTLPADVPKVTLAVSENNWGFIDEVVVRHEDCKTASSFSSDSMPMAVDFFGVDMGNGKYTYVLSLLCSGTGGGEEVYVFREENGGLKMLKKFTYDTFSDDIDAEGTFSDDTHFTVTLQPSGKTVSGMMPLPYSGFKRAGCTLSPMGMGYMSYVENEDGAYDLQYSQRITQGGYNWDNIGYCETKYVMDNNELVMDSQWFEICDGGTLD